MLNIKFFDQRRHILRPEYFFIFLSAFLLMTSPGLISCQDEPWPAGCPHGEEVIPNVNDPDTPGAYFDFSQGKLLFGEEALQSGDIYLDRNFIAGNPRLGVKLRDAMADSLLYIKKAPQYGWVEPPDEKTPARVPIYDGHNIWVRTGEGHIAKFKIIHVETNPEVSSFNWIKIRWIYQPDGSDEFRDVAGASNTEVN